MKNFKKILSFGMGLMLSASFIPNALAVNETDAIEFPGEEVIYYNTFPTGTVADLTEVKCDDFYFHGYNSALKEAINNHADYVSPSFNYPAYKYSMEGVTKVEYNGDIGVRPNGGGIANGTFVLFDFRYSDASANPKVESATPGGLDSGIYRFSLDFVIAESANNTDGFRLQANCMHGNSASNVWWVYGNKTPGTKTVTWGVLKMGNSWTWSENNIPITVGKLHHVDTIFDLDANKIYTFMDGVKYADIDYSGKINFLLLPSSSSISYIDNVLLTKMDSSYVPEMTAEVLESDETGLTVQFSDFMGDKKNLANITYTNNLTGEVIKTSPVGVVDSPNTIKITPEKELTYGYSYTLKADVTVRGLRGGGSAIIEGKEFTLGVVEDVKVFDYNGEEYSLTATAPANTDKFKFKFVEGENAAALLKNLALCDDFGNNVDVTVEPGEKENEAYVCISKNLKADTEYTMTLYGVEKAHKWTFTTGDGGFSVKPVKFYEADGLTPISLSDVKEGDTIKAKYEIVNTGEAADLSFALSMALYSKKGLIDFEYENVELKDGADYYTKTVDFTVSRAEDLSAKGFIWESINTRKPLYKPVLTK